MMGCHGLPLAEVMRQVSPCTEYSHPATGRATTAGAPNAEVCGKNRWCASCEPIHELLFDLPHISQFSDHMATWIGVALQAWASKNIDSFAEADACPEHECGHECQPAST